MKADLDRLMREADIDALFVFGPAGHNPNKQYFTGPVHVTSGYLLKRQGKEPILFHRSMERDEAARSGLRTEDLSQYGITALIEEAGGDTIEASSTLMAKLFEEHEVRGTVALYGKAELGPGFAALSKLQDRLNGVRLVGEQEDSSVIMRARATKDDSELGRMRRIGRTTVKVVRLVAEFLSSHGVKDGVLVNRHSEPLRIREVKRRINLWLGTEGAENLEGTIFAIGRDAGVPHSVGTDDDQLSLGKTIVFDIFPSEAGGGYFYDFTRTWCLGHAPDEAVELHRDVLDAHGAALGMLELGGRTRDVQIAVCDLLKERGHPTPLHDPGTTDGYVHGLGHGLGLQVHESPGFSHRESNHDLIEPRAVFTIEPGLYYPDRELGVRIEDTVWANPDGTFEVLASYPTNLVLEIAGA